MGRLDGKVAVITVVTLVLEQLQRSYLQKRELQLLSQQEERRH